MLLHFILCVLTLPLTTASPRSAKGTFEGTATSRAVINNISKPGCVTQCGKVTVAYPFGIGSDTGCSLDNSFHLTCNSSYQPPKLFLRSSDIEIYNISDSELRISTGVSYRCYDENGGVSENFSWGSKLTAFTFSENNEFTVLGCDDYAFIKGTSEADFSGGCFGLCSKSEDVPVGQCSGMGCCQTSIPTRLNYYNVTIYSLQNHKQVLSFSRCGYAFLGEEGSFEFHGVGDLSNASEFVTRITSTVPVVLDWVIAPKGNCTEATECQENSSCYDVNGGGYRCRCNHGYEGNPYVDPGCQDINECEDRNNNSCYGICDNTPGSYNCTCPQGHIGDARIKNGCLPAHHNNPKLIMALLIGIGVATGIVVLTISFWLFKVVQRRKLKKRKEKFFKRNGGLLLQKQMSSGEGMVDQQTRFFKATELEKATGQFNADRIVGRGGQGTVYKGMLGDGKIVAVKKSMLVDESQVETFINEVFILSQIIHKNVVKLLGCCLETEVPMLVFEFVSNGTLSDFIHNENYEFPTLWKMRLQIATEIAGALSYLHSAISILVYHRDIKSSNILLDDKFRAKVSDFGISKSVSRDQTHLSTLVKGTMGYVDPEYNKSRRLTEKSDVYSFGVVLLELLTGKKAIFSTHSGDRICLATFILSMEDEQLMENVDDRVLDAPMEQLEAVANLAKRCINSNGMLRPNMKDVATELEGMRMSG